MIPVTSAPAVMEARRMQASLVKAFCLLFILPAISANSLQYNVGYTFNGEVVSPPISNFTIRPSNDGEQLIVNIKSKFFGDPPPPAHREGYFRDMYLYETAELFFANDNDRYFQIEIGPYEHYVSFLFDGERQFAESFLFVNKTAYIDNATSTWNAEFFIPLSYLPPKVTKMNAHYMHGTGSNRKYYAYSPAPATVTKPDFHVLNNFAAVDLDTLVPGLSERPMSSVWKNVIQKPLQYTINWTWDSKPLLQQTLSTVTIDSTDSDVLQVTITSPFNNDPPPNVPDGTRTGIIWQYEGAEIFFLNDKNEYFQVIVGPRGHYFAAMYEGRRNKVRRNIFFDVSAKVNSDRKTWTAVLHIPTHFLPQQVTKFNAYYSHGMEPNRKYTAYAPYFYREQNPDYHRLKFFGAIDLDKVIAGLSKRPKSQTWNDVQQRPLKYQILTDLYNKPVTHAPVNITLDATQDGNVLVTFESPFRGGARPPAPDNSRISGMWNYERAEIYFSNDAGQYFNVLLGPYGHYTVYLFDRYRTLRSSTLKLEASSSIDTVRNVWNGRIIIPVRYFPAKVTHWNAYYAVGDGPTATYEALGPSHHPVERPDFHILDMFQPINLDRIIPGMSERNSSQNWEGPLSYDVMSTWDGQPITHVPTTFTLDSSNPDVLTVSISSLFYNDPPPPAPEGSSYVGIWQYEIAEIFFANDRDEYFQLELGPYGQYQAMMLAGERNYKRYQLPLEASATITDGSWVGTVQVPVEYLPEKVTKFNCFYTHGVDSERVYEAFNPDPDGTQPDFHQLNDFAPIDLDEVIPNLSTQPMSAIWSDALQGKISYEIMTLWNGDPIDHDPIRVILEGTAEELYFNIDAPFFNDPPPPCPVGEPCNGLWDYEVVEAFFLNDENQYLEVEVGPYGQHLVLLLWTKNDTYNQMRHSLPMEVTTSIDGDRWTGRAVIPVDYFPPKVTRFNAYDKHYPPPNRQEESLYPQDPTDEASDFHALKYFQPIDFNSVLPDQSDRAMSQLWIDTINGIFRYEIETEWNSVPISHDSVVFSLEGFEGGVELNVSAPFFNDPAPPGEPGQPFYGLWDYEVVEMFFLNDNDEYLEVELSPWGEHLLLMLKGERNTIKHSLALDYVVTQRVEGTNGQPGVWQGSALIPPEYFPPNVTRMNAYAIHGTGDSRVYEALYPAPLNDPDYPAADFHRLELFQPMDFEFLVVDNSQYSQLWEDAIANPDPDPPAKKATDGGDVPVAVKSDTQNVAKETTQAQQPSGAVQATPAPSAVQTEEVTESAGTTQDDTASGQEATITEATETIAVTDGTTVQSVSDLDSFTRNDAEPASTTVDPTTTSAKPDNIPQPELLKEGRVQDISKPIENLFRPLVIRPSGIKPTPSKLSEKDSAKFSNNPVNNVPQFFPRPHFPPPSFFAPQQFGSNQGQVSPYSTGFSLPVIPGQVPLGQPQQFLPPQPHLDHLIHQQQMQDAHDEALSDQQVVHPLPTPVTTKEENPVPVAVVDPVEVSPPVGIAPSVQAPPPVAIVGPVQVTPVETIAEIPSTQGGSFQSEPPVQPQPLPLPVSVGSPVQERKLTQQHSVLLPEQSLQATDPQQPQQAPAPVPTGVKPLVPSAIPTNFPPPHNICYYEGLHPDPHRCPIFHECIYENHEWKVYTWRCPRGKYYDAKLQNCVAGYC